MSCVTRASAFMRHIPVIYRQLSKTGPVCPSHVQFGVVGSPGTEKFRHLTCVPTRYINSHGAAGSLSQLAEDHRTARYPTFQDRNPDRDFRIVLKRLDDMARKMGRITRNQLQVVFDEVSKLGVATPNQSLLLIRSCGSLLPEVQPEERTNLVHQFWEDMKKFGTKYDTSHYNALLKVYLQNEHDFTPTDFLAKMEADNVEPNRVTYQRLISAYCLKGDIPGATQILEFMKTKDLPVTEGVFNSLITGHARSNDMENARNIFNVMRNVGLEPSGDTYTALMSAYAEKGDIAEIEKTILEAESQNVLLNHRHYLTVAYYLAISGNNDGLLKMFERIELAHGYIPETINLCLSLMSRGLDEAAFETMLLLLNTKDGRSSADGEKVNQGNFFMDHAVFMDMPFEKLSYYMDKMIEVGLHSNPHTVALHVALRTRNFAYAEKVFKRMKELDMPIRSHYFWPMLAHNSAQNKEEMKRLLSMMIEMGVPVSIDTYSRYILPVMQADAEEMIAIVQELGGTVDRNLISSLCRWEINNHQLAGIQGLLDQYPELVEVSTFRYNMITAFCRSKEVEDFVRILKHISGRFEYGHNEKMSLPVYLGVLLYDTISAIPATDLLSMKPHLQLLFTRMAEEEIYISSTRFRGIRNLLDRQRIYGLKESALKIVDPSEIEENKVDNMDLFQRTEIDATEVEKNMKDLKEQNANYRSPLRSLILHYCINNDYDKVMELKREFDSAGYGMTAAMYATMMAMCCNLNKPAEALLLHQQMKEFDPSFVLDIPKYRLLLTTLAKNDQMEDLMGLLDEMSGLDVDSFRLERNMFHLLNDLATEGLTEKVKTISEHIILKNVLKPTTNLIAPLVNSYILKDDMTGALECIDECYNKYKLMPHFHDVLVKLIEKGNTEQLQQAMDIASVHHGDINMLYDLIFAFLSSGKLSEAMKVIETPGMAYRDRRLQWFAEKCISNNMEEPLKNLVNITRDVSNCDRDQMYFFLMQFYAKQNNPDQCLQVWTSMQDEGVVPKDRTLRYLANVLNSSNMPVPFEVPPRPAYPENTGEEPAPEVVSRRPREAPVHRGEHPIMTLVGSGNLEEADRQLENYQEEGQEVPLEIFIKVMWEHLKKGNIEQCLQYRERCSKFTEYAPNRSFYNKLTIEYARKGDLENAHKIFCESLSSGPGLHASGLRVLSHSYAEAGDHSKIIEMKEVYEANRSTPFPATKAVLAAHVEGNDLPGALSFAESEIAKHPDRSRQLGFRSFYSKLIQRDELNQQATDFAEQQLANNNDAPSFGLIFAFLDNNRVEEAKAFIEKCPELKEKPSTMLGYVISMVGRDDVGNDVRTRIENVLSMVEGQTYLDREKLYFYLMKECDLSNDWSQGLRVQERMESEGIQLTDLTLKRLGLLLERNGQPVPFTMPPESLAFYRDKLETMRKDHLPEIAAE